MKTIQKDIEYDDSERGAQMIYDPLPRYMQEKIPFAEFVEAIREAAAGRGRTGKAILNYIFKKTEAPTSSWLTNVVNDACQAYILGPTTVRYVLSNDIPSTAVVNRKSCYYSGIGNAQPPYGTISQFLEWSPNCGSLIGYVKRTAVSRMWVIDEGGGDWTVFNAYGKTSVYQRKITEAVVSIIDPSVRFTPPYSFIPFWSQDARTSVIAASRYNTTVKSVIYEQFQHWENFHRKNAFNVPMPEFYEVFPQQAQLLAV